MISLKHLKLHHLGPNAESILPKFYIRPAITSRNSPYTFHPDGFYRVLKSRVYEKLKNFKRGPQMLSVRYVDMLALTTTILSVCAALTNSYTLGILAGAFLTFTVNCSHNFFHQRNNWRMYYFNLSLMSYRVDRDWGLNQIDAVRDRIEVRGNIYLVLISFGDHMLHHLLPSLDHCLLNQLYPILESTCKEFGLNCPTCKTAWSLIVGQYRQLIRISPNRVPKK